MNEFRRISFETGWKRVFSGRKVNRERIFHPEPDRVRVFRGEILGDVALLEASDPGSVGLEIRRTSFQWIVGWCYKVCTILLQYRCVM